ncbi:MAG: hypothetical protein KOO60_02905 [Gemmatimonadales bacterium]|nr:hypothetical protein [Gemmatimonadales bacterium]
MRGLVVLALLVLVLVFFGCSGKNISVNASSDRGDIFDPSLSSEKGPYIPPGEQGAGAGRAAFFNLSTYDWDYAQWLDTLRDRIGELRLPASAETYVEITFLSGPGAPVPEFRVDCTASPDDCLSLSAQIKALPSLPPLPTGFPYSELAVKLSRVP